MSGSYEYGVICLFCDNYAFPLDDIIYWPNGRKHVCYTCGSVYIYYSGYRASEVSEAQAKEDALRLRDIVLPAEIEAEEKLHQKIAHEKSALVRRKSMQDTPSIEDKIEAYDKAYDTLMGSTEYSLTLVFRYHETLEALED